MVRKSIYLTAVILVCNIVRIHAKSLCCEGRNVLLSNHTCANGNYTKKLSCDTKVLLAANSEMTRGEDVFSPLDDKIQPPDKYCFTTKEDGTDVYVMCYDDPYPNEYFTIMTINTVLSLISVFFIVLTIAVYVSTPELLDLQGMCLVWAISGLGCSFIILSVIDLYRNLTQQSCEILACLMYAAFMYAFFWLNIVCFHIWKMIVNPHIFRYCIKRWMLVYHIFGIGGPLILVLVLLTANYSGLSHFDDIHPGIGLNKCWFESQSATLIYFYGPISVLLGINIIYFIWTTIVLMRQMKHCSEKKTKVLKYRLLLCVKLFFVMGITWCFEVVSAILENSTSRWIWVIPDAINALQGLLIFLLLVVFRKRTVRALANKKILGWVKLPASWRYAQDDECEELEEEISLSGADQKSEIMH